MSAGVKLTGGTALQRFFATAGDDIRASAMSIVRETTEQVAADLRRTYPAGPTGALRRRVKTHYPTASVIAGVVSSTAPHAHLYEFGTKTRTTRAGAHRGRMPARPVTPKIATLRRAAMNERLMGIVRAAGFQIDES